MSLKRKLGEWLMTEHDIAFIDSKEEVLDIDWCKCKAKSLGKLLEYILSVYIIKDAETGSACDLDQLQEEYLEYSTELKDLEESDELKISCELNTDDCEWLCTTDWTEDNLCDLFEKECFITGDSELEWTKEWKLKYNNKVYSVYQLNGENEWEFSSDPKNVSWETFYNQLDVKYHTLSGGKN